MFSLIFTITQIFKNYVDRKEYTFPRPFAVIFPSAPQPTALSVQLIIKQTLILADKGAGTLFSVKIPLGGADKEASTYYIAYCGGEKVGR